MAMHKFYKLHGKVIPEDSDVLCTHPMFGPESGKNGWNGLPFMYERVRIRDEATCSSFLCIFENEVNEDFVVGLLPFSSGAPLFCSCNSRFGNALEMEFVFTYLLVDSGLQDAGNVLRGTR